MADIFDPSRTLHTIGGHVSVFMPADQKTSGSIMYFGFVNDEGNWYIMEQDNSNGTYRYVFGKGSYETNFTNRATQTYRQYYDAIDTANFVIA